MKYIKSHWDESRGDKFNYWGTSEWYFELDEDNYVTRQIEIYENGPTLKYDEDNIEDEYGGLAEKTLDLDEMEYTVMSNADFEEIWKK
ncbi:hypothetical protein HQ865_04640 [Mucilaginibacter mali]|uniref:Uncharacterized protein n=1 Tax=Mucilaginibacter mali TaxID=2740462 RepID=A0A7D4PSF8_9SPHI|nr:hypothetical protein [Mucilaginibacter mali]QKJ29068.1 hypothetical protein HQ865_04640 [Mucilaginibacter mali]